MSVAAPPFEGSPAAMSALAALTERLQQRHAGAVRALLFYGSCLRSGDLYDGLVDLYVIVDNYRAAHRSRLSAFGNWLLPPNVYYCEAQGSDGTVRCKYAVLSLEDLETGCSERWFQSYIWGRFCQPVALAWSASDDVANRVREAFLDAAHTFLNRSLPLAPAEGPVRQLWEIGLAASYRTELRAEGGKRPALLVDQGLAHYLAITAEVAADLRPPLLLSGEGETLAYRIQGVPAPASSARRAWRLRQLQGKVLSVARLLKALFTFDGGLDYIAWKLERHSGKPVEIPERVRRWPLIFIWGLMWKLYREGVFR